MKAMHRVAALILMAACLFFYGSPTAAAADGRGERILDYQTDITVHQDGNMTVEETIKVRCEGRKIRRGIWRDLPTDYTDRFGLRYVVGLDILEVEQDGKPAPHHVKQLMNGQRLYIGREDVLLKTGEYTYRVKYATDRQIGFFDDHDELYWNVTGVGWEFPIEHVSATVSLPGGVPASEIELEGYTGPEGSRGRNYAAEVDLAGTATFETTQRLAQKEGLTVVVSWPKGYVAEPTQAEKFAYLLSDNRGLVVGLFGLAGVFLYYTVVWARVGRDPEEGTIIPLYEPPGGLSPAAARYIARMGYDKKAFAAAVINMAVKGYLSISDEYGSYTLTRTGAGMETLTPEERKLAKRLFGSLVTVKIDQANHRQIGDSMDKLEKSLEANFQKKYFMTNRGYFAVGLVASATAVVLGALAHASFPALFMCLWLSIWTIVVCALLWQAASSWRAVFSGRGTVLAPLGTAIVTSLFALPFLAGEVFGLGMLAHLTSPGMVGLVLAAGALNWIFYHLLKAPTLAGRKLMDKIEGFRMFLSVAERDRLNLLNPPEKTPELFERYLPYALALEVEQEWSEQFADVLSRAGTADQPYSPRWYSGTGWRTLGTTSFAGSLGTSFATAAASSARAPGSSSGMGGGGFSGGGGGGGGGGGW